MVKFFIALSFALIGCYSSLANDANYAVSRINKDLLKNADAVVREYNLEINIGSPTEVYTEEHTVITILNENGNQYVNQEAFYSSLIDIQSIEGRIYDKDGELVKKIHSSDFKERSVYANTQQYSDTKERYYLVDYRQYPYTVEYTIALKQKHTFFLPQWQPQESAKCAIAHASLKVSAPENFKLRFKQNLVPEARSGTADAVTTWNWEIKDVNAFIEEPLAYSKEPLTPQVIIAPDKFECEGYEGAMQTWKDMGSFLYNLNKDRNLLPDETKTKVKELLANVIGTREKINTLYAYLQQSTRYVAVEYGIGGWQTIEAGSVYKNKYGDCKALSNYMMALLKEAGIRSYPVVITGNANHKPSFSKNFPHVQGNHEILCIPSLTDTLWLECTSATLVTNYLSNFTDDRTALMITPEGGALVHTPVYDTNVNLECKHAAIVCGDDGVLRVEMDNRYSGLMADELNNRIKYNQPREMQEYENAKFRMASYSADKYAFRRIENDPYMAVAEHVTITANSMYNKRGDRYFVNMNVAPLKVNYTTINAERKTSFYLNNSFAVRDTFMFTVPANTTVEYIPEQINASYSFGRYNCVVTKVDGQLTLIRELILHSGVYDKGLYNDYEKFAALVNGGNQCNVVLVKK